MEKKNKKLKDKSQVARISSCQILVQRRSLKARLNDGGITASMAGEDGKANRDQIMCRMKHSVLGISCFAWHSDAPAVKGKQTQQNERR